jgi:VWFA-related protein
LPGFPGLSGGCHILKTEEDGDFMRTRYFNDDKIPVKALTFFLLIVSVPLASAQKTPDPNSRSAQAGNIQIPSRPADSLFQGEQGNQKTEIRFDPATGMVTLKLLVQDPNGFFIPNIRRDNFVVFENNVRQSNATVEIEHSPVSLALLMEYGGRQKALSRGLGLAVKRTGQQILEQLGRQDSISIFRYGNSIEQLADSSQGYESIVQTISLLDGPPEFSETNFYDALAFTLRHMQGVSGRKAIFVASSGNDTFSKIKYDDLLQSIKDSDTPIYVIGIGRVLRQASGDMGPSVKIDWKGLEDQLTALAKASGGRAYFPESLIDLTSIYDDIMENLRVRYVITYKTSASDTESHRLVRVELTNPKTGGPLEILDATGKVIRASIALQSGYLPSPASKESVKTSSEKGQP